MWGDTTSGVTLSDGKYDDSYITWTLDNVITIKQSKGNGGSAVNSSYTSAPRVYKGHILSFEAADGYKIKSISIECDGAYYGNSMTAGIAVSNDVVTDNSTVVSRTWASTSGGTHVVSSTSDEGLSQIYIQNVASVVNTQLRIKSISITYVVGASSYTITAQSNNNSYGTVAREGNVITATPVDGYRVSTSNPYTVSPEGSATVAQNGNVFTVTPSSNTTVIINFEAIPTHIATFSVNGVTSTQEFGEGADIEFPAKPADVSGKTFVGWVTTAIDGTTDEAPDFVTSATMGQADVTYYAVFAYASDDEPKEIVDVLNLEFTGVSGNAYNDWDGKKATSSAVYAGNSAAGNESIQLRSNNNNSGIITTTSGGNVKKVTITWNTKTTNGRTVYVYGKNSAYSAASDLYNSDDQGDLIGTIECGTTTELSITGDYEYVGLRSESGAMYLDEVKITWSIGDDVTYSEYCTTVVEKPASDLTKTGDITLDYNNSATEADLTDYFTTSSDGAITYTVADETIIEIADELISALKVGTTTVTVSQAATLSYKAGEIVINVTVQDTREDATTIPAINISTLKIGDEGTVSVVNPVKADEGVTFSYATSDEDVLYIEGDEYLASGIGTIAITVTATPSNTNLYKPVVANFEVTVEADVKTNTEIAIDDASGSTVYGTPKSVGFTVTDNYDGELSYVISNEAIADVEIGASAITFTPKAVGTAVITISAPATAAFNAATDVEYTLTVTAPEGGTEALNMEESYTFDFSDNSVWNFPTDYVTGENTYTKDGKTITLNAASSGYKHLGSALLIGKSGATLALPAFDSPVTKITTTGVTGSSSKVTQNIYVGETAVSTATTSAAVNHEYSINPEYQAAGTIYMLKVTNANNTQLTDITVYMNASISATLNGSGYATFCSQYPLDFSAAEGYTAWQIESISGSTIKFKEITGTIKGGQGILLKGDADATLTLTSADSEKELNENLLFGTTAPTYVSDDEYLGLSGEKFVNVKAGTVPAGKALLPASVLPAGARELTFLFSEDGQTTGISEQITENSEKSVYDLQGRKVEQTTKGLYIVNGRKVVVK